jgi:methylthioribose-1-phosphate isomerase
MTIPENPIATLWQWFGRAPLPVVGALVLALGSWVWAIDQEQSNQKTAVAVAAEQAKTAADTAKKMDEKLDRVLEAVLSIRLQQAADNAVKDREDRAAADAAKKKKEPK